MNKNENLIVDQNARIAAMGRKPVRDLVHGDEFTHTIYGACSFVRWQHHGQFLGHAVVYSEGDYRFITLNPAGSVKMGV